ncbi:acetolactate decarboxylase [Agrilactobacillus fermenti]|uniref:acetolactate decarboxylase n=1 Tax=Agrilactobacillus fermenti TaxID=2586909 RepID=UPI001E4FF7D5|nr:acetolactate decarboxylase [Agrilactobacillus fermenti]MCD2256949.1 acetolactate decarboxylase [Agrilactobacillus fermenti]
MDKEDVLYQHGTLALLVPGLFSGTLPVGELLKHGDYGIGSVEALDGELIVVDGKPYLAKSTGDVLEVSDDELVPFANVHYDRPTDKYDRENISQSDLEKEILANHDYHNLFFAVKITGTFKKMQTRAFIGQRPYPTLAQLADNQRTFEADNIDGTVVGYFTPELYQGIGSAGFHVHFLSDNHKFGGHILGFELAKGTVTLQTFTDLDLHLPTHDSTFRRHEFDYDGMDSAIRGAEG